MRDRAAASRWGATATTEATTAWWGAARTTTTLAEMTEAEFAAWLAATTWTREVAT